MTIEERTALADAHGRLGAALVAIAERAGLDERAAAVAHRLGRRGLEHDPIELLHAHSLVLAVLAETLAAGERPALADAIPASRGQAARAGSRAAA